MMQKLIRWVAKLVVFLLADVTVYGKENLPQEGACIVVSNHLGRLDAVLPLTVTPRHDMILMIAEKYQAYAFWRFVARHLDALWLNRFATDFHALREVINRLNRGQFLAMAPEGTRSQTGSLASGKQGAAFLAAKTGALIVPIGLTGTEDRAVRRTLLRPRRARVVVRVGRPFTLPPMDRRSREAYLAEHTDDIMCRIAALLPPDYRGVYAAHPRLQAILNQETASTPPRAAGKSFPDSESGWDQAAA